MKTSSNDRCLSKLQIYIFERVEANELLRYIGTLLHEMVHAIYYTYACRCAQCDIRRSHRTRHGRWWLKTALTVEEFVRSVLKLDVYLGRSQAYGHECFGGASQFTIEPDMALIREVQLDHNEVAQATSRHIRSHS